MDDKTLENSPLANSVLIVRASSKLQGNIEEELKLPDPTTLQASAAIEENLLASSGET